jgi:hypothetical protein
LRLLATVALQADAERPRFARALDALEDHLGLYEEGAVINSEMTAQGVRFLKTKIKGFSAAELTAAADDMIAIARALADAEMRRNAVLGDDLVERVVSLWLELLRSRLQLSPRGLVRHRSE